MTNSKPTAAGAAIDEIHSDILIQALRHLDGRSLASASCATSHLRSLSSQPDLWRRLCLSTWPSLHHRRLLPLIDSSPRRFFSDAYPFPAATSPADDSDLPDKLISAVDLYHRGIPIFSCVVETDTDTSNPWFRDSPFIIDAPAMEVAAAPEDLSLSWIVIDPAKGRAVNLSSRRAVAVGRRHWSVGETVARFQTVRDGWAVGAVMTWRKGKGDVMELALMVEDMDGACVSGMEGLRVVAAALAVERKGKGEEDAKERYLEYLEKKRNREVRREKSQWLGNMWCALVVVVGGGGAAFFFSFVSVFAFR